MWGGMLYLASKTVIVAVMQLHLTHLTWDSGGYADPPNARLLYVYFATPNDRLDISEHSSNLSLEALG